MTPVKTASRKPSQYEETLYKKNLAWLKKNFSGFKPWLEEPHTNALLIRNEEGEPVNIKLGQFDIYPEDAKNLSRKQIDDYSLHGSTIQANLVNFNAPAHPPETTHEDILLPLNQCLTENVKKGQFSPPESRDIASGGFFISLGLGLGFHIDLILKKFDFLDLHIFETQKDHILHAARFHDFAKWDGKLKKKGGRLYFHIVSHWEEISTWFAPRHDDRAFLLRCGARLFKHLNNNCFDHFARHAPSHLSTAFWNKGFFRDEMIMVRNGFSNLLSPACVLQPPISKKNRKTPAIIIGNGPSLDDSIEILKKHRESHLFFSCGTALDTLLRKGIIPDFHCEVENVPATSDRMAFLKKQGYDLSTILPIVSSTVDEGFARFFDQTAIFIRPGVTPTMLMGDIWPALGGTLTTVLNTATAVACSMGITEIYIFGGDLGKKTAHHHSKDSVYYDKSLPDSLKFISEQQSRFSQKKTMHGNLGGLGFDSPLFSASRKLLEGFIIAKAEEVDCFNCSDGIEIKGAIPMLGEMIPRYEAATRLTDIEDIKNDFRPLNSASPLLARRLKALSRLLSALSRRLEGIFSPDRPLSDFQDLVEMADALTKTLFMATPFRKALPARLSANVFLIGSVFGLFGIIAEIFVLYPKGKGRDKILNIARKKCLNLILQMEADSTQLVEEIRKEVLKKLGDQE